MSETTPRAVHAGHSLLLWAARHVEPVAVRLVCGELVEPPLTTGDEAVVAWRGCLAELPAALPFELLGLDVQAVILDAVGCQADWTTDWAGLAATAQVSDRLVVEVEAPADGRPARKLLDAAAMPVLRRRSIFGLGAVADDETPERELPDQTQPGQVRLRTAVRALAGEEPDIPEEPDKGWSWGALALASEGCVSCRVCVRACPEDALALESAGEHAGLGYDPSLCSGCGRCIQCCDVDALASDGRLGPPALLADPVLLELFEVRRCERCGVEFKGSGRHCPVCAFRLANPFGSQLPPGWKPPVPPSGQ